MKILPIALLAGGAYLLWSSRNSSLQGLGAVPGAYDLAALTNVVRTRAQRAGKDVSTVSQSMVRARFMWGPVQDLVGLYPQLAEPGIVNIVNSLPKLAPAVVTKPAVQQAVPYKTFTILPDTTYSNSSGFVINSPDGKRWNLETFATVDAAKARIDFALANPPPAVAPTPQVPSNDQGTPIIPQGQPTIAFRCISGAVLKMPDGSFRAGPLPGYIGADKTFSTLAEATAYAKSFPAQGSMIKTGDLPSVSVFKEDGTGEVFQQADGRFYATPVFLSKGPGGIFPSKETAVAYLRSIRNPVRDQQMAAKPPGSGTLPLVNTQPPQDLTTGTTTLTSGPPASLTPPPAPSISPPVPTSMPVQQIQTSSNQQVASPAATGKINPLVTMGVLAAVPLVMGFMGGK